MVYKVLTRLFVLLPAVNTLTHIPSLYTVYIQVWCLNPSDASSCRVGEVMCDCMEANLVK